MGDDVDLTLLSVLSRRKPLLEYLAVNSTRKCNLVDELDISRSTIDRGIRELEHLDLIERDGRAYRTTLAGELALSEYDRFSNRVNNLVVARDVLSSLPPSTPFDPVFVDGSEVVLSQRPDPQRPARELERQISTADRLRAFSPAFLDHLVHVYRDSIVEGLECEFALTADVLDRLVSHHRETMSEALSTGRVELHEAKRVLPYSLVVTTTDGESTASVLVYVDEGLKGIIYNDDAAAVEWAQELLTDIWTTATPLSSIDV